MPTSTLSESSARQALIDAGGSITVSHIRKAAEGDLFRHLPKQVDLLVPRVADHRSSEEAILHSMSKPLPPRSLVRVAEQPALGANAQAVQLVASPEFLFVQMARFMALAELVELGFELCGCYAMSPAARHGMVERQPVTTPQRIASYLEDAGGLDGVKSARVASRFILENSKSPKESQLAILATLDRRYGGFALEPPLLNYPIELTGAARDVIHQESIRPDLFWPRVSTVIEYDSNDRHVGTAVGERDARRRTGYELLGLNPISITYGQLSSLATITAVFDALARKLGRVRPDKKRSLEARNLLHRGLLFGPKHPRFYDATLAFSEQPVDVESVD